MSVELLNGSNLEDILSFCLQGIMARAELMSRGVFEIHFRESFKEGIFFEGCIQCINFFLRAK